MLVNSNLYNSIKPIERFEIIFGFLSECLTCSIGHSGSMEINDSTNISGVHRSNLEAAEVKRASSASSEDGAAVPLGPTAKKNSPRFDR